MTQGRKHLGLGQVGIEVAQNIAAFRRRSEMTTRELSAALGSAGRPIPASGITRIELRQRRVDVDDLMALSKALGCSVKALMEGPTCAVCLDAPPEGFTCNACAAGGY